MMTNCQHHIQKVRRIRTNEIGNWIYIAKVSTEKQRQILFSNESLKNLANELAKTDSDNNQFANCFQRSENFTIPTSMRLEDSAKSIFIQMENLSEQELANLTKRYLKSYKKCLKENLVTKPKIWIS